MTAKKRILLLTTGGTIASVPGGEGLEPRRSEVMERELEQLRTYYDISVKDVICLDSSNIRPEEWQLIARHVFEDRAGYDGIVVSHGTDTMAYTASAVTFMLPNIDVPVVFTGSQLPLTDMLSDGPDNLRTAFAMAASMSKMAGFSPGVSFRRNTSLLISESSLLSPVRRGSTSVSTTSPRLLTRAA